MVVFFKEIDELTPVEQDEHFEAICKRKVRVGRFNFLEKSKEQFRLKQADFDDYYSCSRECEGVEEFNYSFSREDEREEEFNDFSEKSFCHNSRIRYRVTALIKFTVNNNRNLGAYYQLIRGKFYFKETRKSLRIKLLGSDAERLQERKKLGDLYLKFHQATGFVDILPIDEATLKELDCFYCSFDIALAGPRRIFKGTITKFCTKLKLEIFEGDDFAKAKEKLRKIGASRVLNISRDFESLAPAYELSENFFRCRKSLPRRLIYDPAKRFEASKALVLNDSFPREPVDDPVGRFEASLITFVIPKLSNKDALRFMIGAVFDCHFEILDKLEIFTAEPYLKRKVHKHHAASLIAIAALRAFGERGLLLKKAIEFASRTKMLVYLEGDCNIINIDENLASNLKKNELEKIKVNSNEFQLKCNIRDSMTFIYPDDVFCDLEGIFELELFLEARNMKDRDFSFNNNLFCYARLKPSGILKEGFRFLLRR